MTGWTLIRNSLRHHWRSHLGTFLGAAIGSAVLIGALIVGDSVRESLKAKALDGTAGFHNSLFTQDRLFPRGLGQNFPFSGQAERVAAPEGPTVFTKPLTPGLVFVGTAAKQNGSARANHVQILGFDPVGKLDQPTNGVILNRALAEHLKANVGDSLILRFPKRSALSQDAVIAPKDDATVALKLKVSTIIDPDVGGNFSPVPGASAPMNAFVRYDHLSEEASTRGQANLLLTGAVSWALGRGDGDQGVPFGFLMGANSNALDLADQIVNLERKLREHFMLEDASLLLTNRPVVKAMELVSGRIFLDPPVVTAALKADDTTRLSAPVPLLTYMVNLLIAGTNQTPYSMVTAVGAPYTPADMKDDEIVVNQWLADDLHVRPGDSVAIRYFAADSASQLIERTNTFRVRNIVPLGGIYDDRTLMPDFPGVAKAESTKEWDAGFPLVHKIRDQDETYWNQHKGTPKAFVTLASGQKMWGNRWGSLTAVRWMLKDGADAAMARSNIEKEILANLSPSDVGLRFVPIREEALKAATGGQDFGGLFIGFSFFLIAAALILMSMLFQFGLEQRAPEIGTLLAVGWRPKKIRRLLLGEGLALAFLGGIAGVIGGAFYAKAMIGGLNTIWNDAIGGTSLGFYLTPLSLVIGLLSSVVVAGITLWLALRKQARRPARELLAEGGSVEDFATASATGQAGRLRKPWLGLGCIALALVTVAAAFGLSEKEAQTGAFFGGGSLLLIGGILLASWRMKRTVGRASRSSAKGTQDAVPTLADLAARSIARRRKRSVATIALLASGSFLIVAVGANRLDANLDAAKRSSGTGGFAFLGESSLPIVDDPNTTRGRENLNLPDKGLEGVSFVPMRVKDGDEASCLNLGRAQRPRLLGVNPGLLAKRGSFTFASLASGITKTNGWNTLMASTHPGLPADEVPAIGDANSIQWAMGKSVGDTLDYVDESGQPFKVRIVGAVANSILQGQLLIDEAAFKARFPSIAGHRMFLIDAPSDTATNVSATLSRALQDYGLELTPTVTRLNQFNAVQNTYLGTFQILGGLGLLLGSAGLGVVVLRNVLERRSELAVMQAVGFSRATVRGLVLREHVTLLWAGLGLGIVAALIAVVPAIRPGSEMPWLTLGITLLAIVANGFLWTWLATRFAMRGQLLEALRNQ
jgi:putative ABC transport system permease protein